MGLASAGCADRDVELDLVVEGLLARDKRGEVVATGRTLLEDDGVGFGSLVLAGLALLLAEEGLVANEGDLEVLRTVQAGSACWYTEGDAYARRDLRVTSLVHLLRHSSMPIGNLAIHRVDGVSLLSDLPWLHDSSIIRRLQPLMLHCRN